MFIKTIFPTTVNKFFSSGDDNKIVKKSNSTFYHLLGAGSPSWTTPAGAYFPTKATYTPPTKKVLQFRLAVIDKLANIPVNCKFNFDNINFSNQTNVTSPNNWIKSLVFSEIKDSINEMFTNTGVFDNWVIAWTNGFEQIPVGTYTNTSYNYHSVVFTLTRKVAGDLPITSTMYKMESLIDNIWLNNDIEIYKTPTHPDYIKGLVDGAIDIIFYYRQFFDYQGVSFNAMIREYYSLSNEVLDTLSFFELGLDINKVNSFPSDYTYITSISKRLLPFGDFEPLFIANENTKNWKPNFGNFNFYVSKYLDVFNFKPFQSYIDPSIPNNTIKKKVLDPSSYNISIVDAYHGLYENYSSNDTLSTTHNYIDDYYTGLITASANSGTGFNNQVRVIATASDGSLFVGGNFTTYGASSSKLIIKIKPSGAIDNTFNSKFINPLTVFNNPGVYTIKEQPDGKILIGGDFKSYDGTYSFGITRTNSDGSFDNTFTNYDSSMGFNNTVRSIDLQLDGKILVGGDFTSYEGITASRIIRLNSDGTKDTTFDNSIGFNGNVNTLQVVGTSSIMLGGEFTTYKGATAHRIINLNMDGSNNLNLKFGNGFDQYVTSILVNSFDLGGVITPLSMVVGGSFNTYGGGFTFSGVNNECVSKSAKKLVYLTLSQVVTSVSPYTITPYSIAYINNSNLFHNKLLAPTDLFVLAIHKIDSGYLIGGVFNNYGGIPVANIVKVDSVGNKDIYFNSISNQLVQAFSNIEDQIIVGGDFTSFNGNTLSKRISFIKPDGSVYESITFIPRLLTNQPIAKRINKGYEVVSSLSTRFDPENVTMQSGSPDKISIDVVHLDNSRTHFATYSASILTPIENKMFINTLTFNVNNLIELVSPTQSVTQSIKYIDVTFNLLDHKNISYVNAATQRYILDNISQDCISLEDDKDYTPIVFKNAEGGYDLFEFEQVTELKVDRKIDTYMKSSTYLDSKTSDFNSVFNIDYVKSYSTITRILSDEEFIWLEELGRSKSIYILNLDDLKLYPIVIDPLDYSSKLNTDKKISITFKYSRPEVTY